MAASNLEQLLLELINDARIDPLGNAARYITSYSPLTSNNADIQNALTGFGVNGTILQNAFNALTAVQPLAWNENLANAANDHSQAMIDKNSQSHQVSGELDLGPRVTAAGYNWNFLGESIFAFSKSMMHAHAGFMVDWGNGPGGMQNPPGHRDNIMSPNFREVGLGIIADPLPGVGPLVVTQDFGRNNALNGSVIILGVNYTDNVIADDFYSDGEGVGGLTVAVSGAGNVNAAASGGFSLITSATGARTITFSNGGLSSNVTFATTLVAGNNYKLDIVDAGTANSMLQTTLSGTMGDTGASILKGLGVTGLTLTTGTGAQTIIGTRGNDTIDGGADADKLQGGLGDDTYTADSTDTLTEAADAGTDTVKANFTYTLLNNFENLTLTAGDINGTGNAAANVIEGSSGKNTIAGGAGNDSLKGNSDADTFVFKINDDIDTVEDFNRAQGDKIDLTSFVNIHSKADLYALAVTETNGHTTFDLGNGDKLTVKSQGQNTFTDNDFEFLEIGTPPSDIALSNNTIAENASIGAVIGKVSGADPDPLDDLTFTLVNNAGGRFSISGTDLKLAGPIDFETNTTHIITIRATDEAGNKYDEQLTINITDAGGNTITGSGEKDTINGSSSAPNQSVATIENDTIDGGGGNDVIDALAGNDIVIGGAGDDKMVGGLGVDTLSYAGTVGNLIVKLSQTSAQNTLGAGKDTVSQFENLTGGLGDDTLIGDKNANTLDGGAGNDILDGGLGADELIGGGNGTGGDTASYSAFTVAVTASLASANAFSMNGKTKDEDTFSGIENLTGGKSHDALTGDDKDNVIEGGAGNDLLHGGASNANEVSGDTASYASATTAVTVSLNGTNGVLQDTKGAGKDTLTGFENLTGGKGGDTLTGDSGANIIKGELGDDLITGGEGNDVLNGGGGTTALLAGSDTVSYVGAAQGVSVNLSILIQQDTKGAGKDTLSEFENIIGSDKDDTLTGDANANVIQGNLGDDAIEGGLGNDTLEGGGAIGDLGSDTLSYANAGNGVTVSLLLTAAQNTFGAGSDTVSGFENLTGSALDDKLTGDKIINTLTGGDGNDVLEGGLGSDALFGGNGSDTASFAGLTVAVSADLSSGSYMNGKIGETDTFNSIENLIGGKSHDTLTGDDQDNVIEGGAGNDILSGGASNANEVSGDTVSYANASSAVTVSLDGTNGLLQDTRGAGKDTLTGFENITGGKGGDKLTGNADDNDLIGNAGNDSLFGAGGSDTLDGGLGNDLIVGGSGDDTLTGGIGKDTFFFEFPTDGKDSITDFAPIDDTLRFDASNFGGGLAAGASLAADRFVAGAAPAANQAFGQFLYGTADGQLLWDADGTNGGAAVLIATLTNAPTLALADFNILA